MDVQAGWRTCVIFVARAIQPSARGAGLPVRVIRQRARMLDPTARTRVDAGCEHRAENAEREEFGQEVGRRR